MCKAELYCRLIRHGCRVELLLSARTETSPIYVLGPTARPCPRKPFALPAPDICQPAPACGAVRHSDPGSRRRRGAVADIDHSVCPGQLGLASVHRNYSSCVVQSRPDRRRLERCRGHVEQHCAGTERIGLDRQRLPTRRRAYHTIFADESEPVLRHQQGDDSCRREHCNGDVFIRRDDAPGAAGRICGHRSSSADRRDRGYVGQQQLEQQRIGHDEKRQRSPDRRQLGVDRHDRTRAVLHVRE